MKKVIKKWLRTIKELVQKIRNIRIPSKWDYPNDENKQDTEMKDMLIALIVAALCMTYWGIQSSDLGEVGNSQEVIKNEQTKENTTENRRESAADS